jgi:hypothetical protein
MKVKSCFLMKLSENEIYDIFRNWLLSNGFPKVTFKSPITYPTFTMDHDGSTVGIQVIITDELALVKEKVINTFSQFPKKKTEVHKLWLFFINLKEPIQEKMLNKIDLYIRDFSSDLEFETSYYYIQEDLELVPQI